MLTFAQDDIVRMAREDFVPVAADDWYQRRRRDAEGEYFRSVANQGPRKGEGGGTRQGIYCFTAGGKLLAYRNHHDPDVMREEIARALKKFKALPASERAPGAVEVPEIDEAKLDKQYHRAPPKDALILRQHGRVLEKGEGGLLQACEEIPSGNRGIYASRDHVWITPQEWRSIVPADVKAGQVIELPASITERLCRFHLLDNTRGEPPMWKKEEIRRSDIKLTVDKVTPDEVTMTLRGSALMTTNADETKADRGFDVHLLGPVVFNRKKQLFTRFEVVALGDAWGEGGLDRGARPGRNPLGIVFEMVSGKEPGDRVPPQAARDIGTYLRR